MATTADPARLLDDLRRLVEVESFSADLAGCHRCADVLTEIGGEVLGASPERLETDGRPHLRWRFGEPRVAILGHFDTVWPAGTLASRPFAVDGDVATGPGIFDMKGGVIQGLHALAGLASRDGVEVLFTSDEEIASPTSRPIIEDLARRVDAVLVLEPPAGEAVKDSRKGVAQYRVSITGRAAHAGLEPHKGVNALVELAALIPDISALANPGLGTSVVPTRAEAGIAGNVVPPSAWVDIDSRAETIAEQERVDAAMHALRSHGAAVVEVTGGPDRPPLERERAAELLERAREVAPRAGIRELQAVGVGGASDGNITAAVGARTLDGLGSVGAGAHAPDEHILVSHLPVRTELLRLLLEDLLGG